MRSYTKLWKQKKAACWYGRLFSYTDTQLIRLSGPNFHEIPINRSVAPVHNNQRDGYMRQTINKSRAPYEPNTLGGGCPFQATAEQGGFVSYPERINSPKLRERGEKFLITSAKHGFFTIARPTSRKIISSALCVSNRARLKFLKFGKGW